MATDSRHLACVFDFVGIEPNPVRDKVRLLGSTAKTCRSRGSYEPAHAPTLTIVRASPSAPGISAALDPFRQRRVIAR